MSCCGNNRSRFYGAQANSFGRGGTAPEVAIIQRSTPTPVIFEYIGATGLSAVGSATRKLYRFDAKNARVAVDPRDASGMNGVPNLRRVR